MKVTEVKEKVVTETEVTKSILVELKGFYGEEVELTVISNGWVKDETGDHDHVELSVNGVKMGYFHFDKDSAAFYNRGSNYRVDNKD